MSFSDFYKCQSFVAVERSDGLQLVSLPARLVTSRDITLKRTIEGAVPQAHANDVSIKRGRNRAL